MSTFMKALLGVWIAVLIGAALHLPLSVAETFGIEQRFGFNHTTVGLWLTDLIKGVVLGLILGVPILWVILKLMAAGGTWWWLWAWLALVAYQLLVMWIAPHFIMPVPLRTTRSGRPSLRLSNERYNPSGDSSLKPVFGILASSAGPWIISPASRGAKVFRTWLGSATSVQTL